MSNKHYVKRLLRIARQQHKTIAEVVAQGSNARLANHGDLTGVRQLYDVARNAEKAEKNRRKAEATAAYQQRAKELGGAPSDPLHEMKRLVKQEERRKARSK